MTKQLCNKSCYILQISHRIQTRTLLARNICWSFFMHIFSGKHFDGNNRSTFERPLMEWIPQSCSFWCLLLIPPSPCSIDSLVTVKAACETWIHLVRWRGENMTQKYQSYSSSTSQLNECCFMNVVIEINAKVHSFSLSFLTRKTNKQLKRKQDWETKWRGRA